MSPSGKQRQGRGQLALGILVVGMGCLPLLAALDVIPTPDEAFHAPRWLVALFASCFLLGGLVLAVRVAPFGSAHLRERISAFLAGTLAVTFLTTGAIFLTLQLLQPGGEPGTLTVGGLTLPLPGRWAFYVDRALVGFVALLTDLLALAVWGRLFLLLGRRLIGRVDARSPGGD